MFLMFPPRMELDWTCVAAQPPAQNGNLVIFQSQAPLMGAASFEMSFPERATGLYIGVQQWCGHQRMYCRIDNVFQETAVVSFVLNDSPPQAVTDASYGPSKFTASQSDGSRDCSSCLWTMWGSSEPELATTCPTQSPHLLGFSFGFLREGA